VSNRNDSGTGSLRQAIVSAAAGDTITFGITGTITLTSGALTIDKDLSIQGPGPHHLKISGNHASRVFVIQGGTVTVAGMTISDGRADANSPILASTGGGILNYASLTLSNDVVSDNAALGDASAGPFGLTGWGIAGGIASFGTLSVTASQFTGNLARGGDGSVGAVGSGVGGAIGNWGPPQSPLVSSPATWLGAATATGPARVSAAPSETPAPSPSPAARSLLTRPSVATTLTLRSSASPKAAPSEVAAPDNPG
jgi:hypothetical protein